MMNSLDLDNRIVRAFQHLGSTAKITEENLKTYNPDVAQPIEVLALWNSDTYTWRQVKAIGIGQERYERKFKGDYRASRPALFFYDTDGCLDHIPTVKVREYRL